MVSKKDQPPTPPIERRKRRTMSQNDTFKLYTEERVFIPKRQIVLSSMHVDAEGNESGTDVSMFQKLHVALEILEYFDKTGPITIVMNNPGGDWYHGMAIYDRIRNSPCPITIEGYGPIMSMGSVILQAGTKRLLARHAAVLLHYGSASFAGPSKDLQQYAEHDARNATIMEDIYLDRIKKKLPEYTREQLAELIKHDRYLTAAETIKIGLADGFIR